MAPSTMIGIDGGELWLVARGSGPPLILHPGGPGCCDYLEPVAAPLEQGLEVIRFDPRGCGRSDDIPPYTLETCLADLEAIREALGFEDWFVGGHSWGADAALAYALSYPERTRGVVYLSGTGLQNDRQWHAAYSTRTHEERMPTWDHPPNDGINRLIVDSWREFLKTPDVHRRVAELQVPFLVVYGREDIRPSWPAEQLAALLPGARLELIPEADHFLWRSHSAELTQMIADFCREPQLTGAELVRRLWEAMEARRWEAVGSLLAPEFQCSWPQSGERYGREQFLRLNRHYPGGWHLRLVRLIDGGDWVVSEVEVELEGRTDPAVSLFRCAGGQLVELREYWPEPFEVPEWRRAMFGA